MNFSSDPINTIENLIAKNKTKSISIYLIIIIGMLVFLGSLEYIKEMDAQIKYCKKKGCFYYAQPFDLEINYTLKDITEKEEQQIFGGFHFRPILLDGSMFNLFQQKSSRETFFVTNN